MMAGGGLAAGLTFNELLLAMILGNIFLCIIAGLVSVIAYKTGLTFALLTRYSFGQEGSRIASLFVPIVNLGWYTIQAALYGHFIAQVFNLSYTGEVIAMMLSAVIMGIFAVLGIKSLAVFGYIAIPSIILVTRKTNPVQTIVREKQDFLASNGTGSLEYSFICVCINWFYKF